MPVEVAQFICLNDNFGLLIHDFETGATASVDAPDGEAIAAEAGRRGWPLTHLLITHHHADHIQGAEALKRRFPSMKIVGAAKDAHRLPPLDQAVRDGDEIAVGAARALYCGHEYTQANGRFALTVDPENPVLRDRVERVAELRAAGKFTLPTTIALENATNPFLRVEDPDVKKAMGMDDANPFAVFAAMRARKNGFTA